MKKVLVFAFMFLAAGAQAQVDLGKTEPDDFAARLEGNYDSEEQSHSDPSFYSVEMHIKEISLKGKHPNGHWYYMEQSMISNPSQPFKQAIYRVYKEDKQTIATEVFDLKNPIRFAGAWSNTELLKKTTVDSLIDKPGCKMLFHKDEAGNYYGNIDGKGCASNLNEAAYTTNDITMYSYMMQSWERGWDKDGQQVWGVTKGPYKFRKFTIARKPKDD